MKNVYTYAVSSTATHIVPVVAESDEQGREMVQALIDNQASYETENDLPDHLEADIVSDKSRPLPEDEAERLMQKAMDNVELLSEYVDE